MAVVVVIKAIPSNVKIKINEYAEYIFKTILMKMVIKNHVLIVEVCVIVVCDCV